MNRYRFLIGAVVAVVIGLVASNYVYRQMSRVTAARPVEMKKMVAAAARLPLGTRLEAQHLRYIPWPNTDPIPGMFERVEDVLGRAVITSLVENEAILDSRLAPREGGAGLPATIPEGMRAISVPVNDVVAVAGFVGPGTMVDVLVTGSVDGRGGGTNSITRMILENIRVLAAGQKIEQDKDGKPQTVPVITLLVTPEQATSLAMASTEGRIQLALRNTVDLEMASPPPVYRTSLFAGAPVPVRRAAAAAPKKEENVAFTVEVLRGSQKETRVF